MAWSFHLPVRRGMLLAGSAAMLLPQNLVFTTFGTSLCLTDTRVRGKWPHLYESENMITPAYYRVPFLSRPYLRIIHLTPTGVCVAVGTMFSSHISHMAEMLVITGNKSTTFPIKLLSFFRTSTHCITLAPAPPGRVILKIMAFGATRTRVIHWRGLQNQSILSSIQAME